MSMSDRRRQAAEACIDGEIYEFHLIGRQGDWNWRCPDGERAGDGAGGATKSDALQNLQINLRNEEPGFAYLHWV